MASSKCDILIIGAGAAGLMAAIAAGRAPGRRSVVAVDGAATLGAKILVAGGGRCNVTHHAVTERAYAGSTRGAIRTVLRRFDVPQTVAFFREIGVILKREETGKLFPVTDSARTVLDGLLGAARSAGVALRHPARIVDVIPVEDGFDLRYDEESDSGPKHARRIILATGGCALPKSGSDGFGLKLVRRLGHTVTALTPALVPLRLERGHPLTSLSGLAVDGRLDLCAASGKKLHAVDGAILFTHFGLSGPAVLDVSRHLLAALRTDPGAGLRLVLCPDTAPKTFDDALLGLGNAPVRRWLRDLVPQRLADTLLDIVEIDHEMRGSSLRRDSRRALVDALTALPLNITGDRGYTHAEVTAGGVPLRELDLASMESKVVPGLHLCGEICDVDGQIGGFNFQWAWASGWQAGGAAADNKSA